MKPSRRKEMAKRACREYRASIRLVCSVFGISESDYHYQTKLSTENAEIADWLLRLTTANRRWGFGLCFLYLRNVKGFGWNHKRVYRIYRELELNLRIKPKRRIKRDKPNALMVPATINQVWSIDFMSDSLSDGRTLRTFNVLDDYNILFIPDEYHFEKFYKMYSVPHPADPDGKKGYDKMIDWPRVANDYAGIEICPYLSSKRNDDDSFWYYGWDVASGCVWDPSGIKELIKAGDCK